MKVVLLVLIMFAVMALPITPASAKNRSFDECRQLSVERGVKNPNYPRRYLGLEATGANRNPKGSWRSAWRESCPDSQ